MDIFSGAYVIIEMTLFVFLLTLGIAVLRIRNLFSAAMLTGVFSLVSAGLFTVMDAVDVAFTEAAVGAGMSTVLILATLALTGDEIEIKRKPKLAPIVVTILAGAVLIYGTLDMPAYGDPNAIIHQHLAPDFMLDSQREIGIPNVVTSVLASYRGFDTFGELTVIFTAAIGVTLLLGRRREDEVAREDSDHEESKRKRPQAVRDMPVLRIVMKFLVPIIILFSIYVQAHGDFGPGGGFQAGVIFASAMMMYAMVYGSKDLEKRVPSSWVEFAIPAGLLLYGGVGVFSILRGRNFLDYSALGHGQHGQHLGILLVELGVGITVAAAMLTIYYRFAGRQPATKRRSTSRSDS